MKIAYIDNDYTVREIIPPDAVPVKKWYNDAFASHCVEVQDNVKPNQIFNPDTQTFFDPVEKEQSPNILSIHNENLILKEQIRELETVIDTLMEGLYG